MHIRRTPDAANDLAHIVDFIREENPEAARRVATTVFDSIVALRTFPYRGRHGLVPETRELVLGRWPYIVVYRVAGDQVQVLRVRHAAQNWP
jgi:addiction module RelE/StbE family toxin